LWHTGKRGFCWGMFGSCTLMVRAETIKKFGGFDENFKRCAEWDVAARAAYLGAHFIAVDNVLVHQFKTPSADKANMIPLIYALQLRRKHKAYMNGKGRGLHLASIFLASARFYGAKNNKIAARIFRGLHFILVCGR